MARKKTEAEATTEAAEQSIEDRIAAARADAKFVDFDLKGERPADGDLCLVRCFDPGKGKAVDGPVAVFDEHRGVFFKDPEHGGGGSVIGPRRDNYKAERVRNVTAFAVVVEGHDPAPLSDSIIDHVRGLEHASARPPQVTTPPDRD